MSQRRRTPVLLRTAALLAVLAAVSVLVFAALGVHIALGGVYEVRTVAAMALRCTFWIGLAWFAARTLRIARD